MYKVKESTSDGFVLVDGAGQEIEFKTKLPFYPGDKLTDIYTNIKMVDMHEALLAHQVLRMAEVGSDEYEYAKSVILENEQNPTFMEGTELIKFLAYRKTIKKLANK